MPHKPTYEERMPFFGIRWNAIHVRFILWMDVHHPVMCVVCTCYFSPLSTSFVSDTLKVIRSSYVAYAALVRQGLYCWANAIKGPVTQVPRKPTYEERMSFFGIRWNAIHVRFILCHSCEGPVTRVLHGQHIRNKWRLTIKNVWSWQRKKTRLKYLMMSVQAKDQTGMKRISTDAKKMAFVPHTQAYAALVWQSPLRPCHHTSAA